MIRVDEHQEIQELQRLLDETKKKLEEYKQYNDSIEEEVATPVLKFQVITPEHAKEMLAHRNPDNRNTSIQTVRAYASDMREGKWDGNAVSPIVFDKMGVLRNGHHRLEAIVMADTPVACYVVEGADSSNIYDLGRVRSINNVLQMDGIEVDSHVTAIIRAIFELLYRTNKVPLGKIKRAYEEDGESLRMIAKLCRTGANNALMKQSPASAAMYVAYKCGVPIETITEFVYSVNTGFQDDHTQTADVIFRNQMFGLRIGSGHRESRRKIFLGSQEALSDYAEHRKRLKGYTGKTAKFGDMFIKRCNWGDEQ